LSNQDFQLGDIIAQSDGITVFFMVIRKMKYPKSFFKHSFGYLHFAKNIISTEK